MSDAIDWDAKIPATWALGGALVGVWLATGAHQWYVGYEGLPDALIFGRSLRFRSAVGAQMRGLVAEGEVFRLWTSLFTHASVAHLATNAIAVATLGRALEPWIGAPRFIGWFVVGGLAGAGLTHLVGILASDGASGGAFALMGALAVLAWRRRERMNADDRRALGPYLWGFIALNLVLSFALPFVNAAGHLGGLIAGLVLGATFSAPTRAVGWTVFSAVSIAIAAVGWAWLALT